MPGRHQVRPGTVEGAPDQLVGEERIAGGGHPPPRRLIGQAARDLGSARFERGAEDAGDFRPSSLRHGRDPSAELSAIDDCAAILDQLEAGRLHQPRSFASRFSV